MSTAINQAEALRFLAVLGKDPAAARFRFFPHKRNPRAASIGARKLQGFDPATIARHQAAGCGAYVVIGEGGDSDAKISSIGALFVEWDDREIEWQRQAWQELGLPEPTLQVATGGASIHCYWRLTEPLPPDQWRQAQLRLIAHCSSDPKIKNPSRVMRLPGCAYIGADGQPIGQTRIIHATEARYSLAAILAPTAELPPPRPAADGAASRRTTPTPARIALPCSGQARPLEQVREALAAIPPILPDTGKRDTFRALAWGLLQAVREAGGDDATAAALLQAHSPAVTDAALYLRTDPHSITAGSFWYLARGAGWRPKASPDVGPRPVLPSLPRVADQTAPAGRWLADGAPFPSPEAAPLLVVAAPMGTGKTEALAAALAPLAADGVAVLMPSHRKALGQAAAERVGVPWCPAPRSDERLQGVAGCWDSWCPDSGLRISGHGWSGGALVLDEWGQACEHLLLSTGTALAKRRGAVLRTAADQLPRMRQTVAMDAQMPEWAVRLLERLTGRRAWLIRSEHRPMEGRPLHCPAGFKTPKAAADAFRAQWAQLVADGAPFLCWTSAQKAGSKNAPQTLAALHRQRVPGARVAVIDSTTPEAAADLAADPDGFAAGLDALYVSPSISSGVSFASWRPAAVIALAGGRIAPEHAAQALARVRCPEVPAYLFAPERCPGAALRVGSGSTDPAELIRHLRAVSDPLLGQLEGGDAEGAWLQAWAELGAHRNRQRFAYRATIAGLLDAEGWQLQAPGPAPCPAAGAQAAADLEAIAAAAQAAEDQALIDAPPLTDQEAAELARNRRKLEPSERAALDRHRLAAAWGLQGAPPSQALIDAGRKGLRDRLRLGWLLTTPEALALVPAHDQAAIAALDATGRPFEPDRLRVALAPRIAALQALGLPALLQRFARGETIAATDPAVVALHTTATAHRGQLAAAAGISPGVKATGTLRALLAAVGWKLERAGRINTRTAERGALTYRAQGLALPEGVDHKALAAAWLAELQAPTAGALFAPIRNPYRGRKCATGATAAPPPPPRPARPWPLIAAAAIPWPSRPPTVPLAAA